MVKNHIELYPGEDELTESEREVVEDRFNLTDEDSHIDIDVDELLAKTEELIDEGDSR